MGGLAMISLMLDLLQSIANQWEIDSTLSAVDRIRSGRGSGRKPAVAHFLGFSCHWAKLLFCVGSCVVLICLVGGRLIHP